MKRVLILLVVLGCIVLGWGSYQYHSITKIGEYTMITEADVIIILGAAVWPHGPSPALQSRILHGKNIYEKGQAQYFILSGD